MNKKKILFLGQMYDVNCEEKLLNENTKGIGIASNILQQNFVKALQNIESFEIKVISSLPVGNYPNLSKVLFYPSNRFFIKNTEVYSTFTLNLPIIKHILRYLEYKKYFKKWIKDNDDGVIIFYDFYGPFLNLSKWIKKKKYNVKRIAIIPDLIGNLRNDTNVYKWAKKLNQFNNKNRLSKMINNDAFIGVSKEIKNFLTRDNTSPFLEINGIVDIEGFDMLKNNIENDLSDKTVFMYAGNLSSQYNVDKMVEEFIESDLKSSILIVCGSGELDAWLKIKSESFSNILYYGLLSKEKVNFLTQTADVLINPRPNKGEYVKYSFPSKNLEYLLAGKSVLCFKLPPFDNTFDSVFDYYDESSMTPYLDKFIVYSQKTKNDLQRIGFNNRRFVLSNFGYDNLSKPIEKFILEVLGDNNEKG